MSHLRTMIAHGYNAFTSVQRLYIYGSKTRKCFCNLEKIHDTQCVKITKKVSFEFSRQKLHFFFFLRKKIQIAMACFARNVVKWDIFALFLNTVVLLTWHGFKTDETNKQAGLCEEGSAASRLMYGIDPRPIFNWFRRLFTPLRCS